MADFENDLLTYLSGKHPDYPSTSIEYDLEIKPSTCRMSHKRASLPRVGDDEPAMLKRNLTIICGVVLIDEQNRVLLIQEAKASCRGKWYLPAGRLDENETIEEGAKRELKEEAGVDFEPTSLICVESIPGLDSSWVRFTYTGKITGGEIKTPAEADKESLQAKWFPVTALKNHTADIRLRARDVYNLVEVCERHQMLVSGAKPIASVLPGLEAHKHMCNRVVLARKTKDNFDVLISTKGTTTSHLPLIRDFGVNLPTAFEEIFKSEIDLEKGPKGILCVEHAGRSREIYADGVCLTILVFTTTTKEPTDRNEFIWHRVRNAKIIADLERRLEKPESSIPLFH